jgi:bifunctional N-acetylglucosamine-1-phosphate-uridyltransferase/glucosamine-1-phosphate-acetyltransferase GlmU-like protein
MSLNILILAAGRSKNDDSEYDFPQCLVELDGTLLIERILETTKNIDGAHYFCAILEEDARRFRLDTVFQQLITSVSIIKVPQGTKGSACTALLAAVQMQNSLPLLILSSNELVKLDQKDVIEDFVHRELDAGTLTFRAVHPRYSYVRTNSQGYIEEASQHRPISQQATAGVFWYARTFDFVEAAKNLIRKDASDNGSFYIAPTFNELILNQLKVGNYPIPKGAYIPLKNDHQRKRYEEGTI